uniref:Uncharacterized protein n=1 Tax=Anguilla anguilla TaxID=7936 RepID=A0A0E9TS87_ANGAN
MTSVAVNLNMLWVGLSLAGLLYILAGLVGGDIGGSPPGAPDGSAIAISKSKIKYNMFYNHISVSAYFTRMHF